jgi:hypothetical protein
LFKSPVPGVRVEASVAVGDGDWVGLLEGVFVGEKDPELVGLDVGLAVGEEVGVKLPGTVGEIVGLLVGVAVPAATVMRAPAKGKGPANKFDGEEGQLVVAVKLEELMTAA